VCDEHEGNERDQGPHRYDDGRDREWAD